MRTNPPPSNLAGGMHTLGANFVDIQRVLRTSSCRTPKAHTPREARVRHIPALFRAFFFFASWFFVVVVVVVVVAAAAAAVVLA